jgi:hypothetical protein
VTASSARFQWPVRPAQQGLNEDNWIEDEFKIFDEEKNTSLDIQFIKRKNPAVKNNNVVVNVRNQYGELLPFYVIPIGGVPKYKYTIADRKPVK